MKSSLLKRWVFNPPNYTIEYYTLINQSSHICANPVRVRLAVVVLVPIGKILNPRVGGTNIAIRYHHIPQLQMQ
jgi:hypothetical protein